MVQLDAMSCASVCWNDHLRHFGGFVLYKGLTTCLSIFSFLCVLTSLLEHALVSSLCRRACHLVWGFFPVEHRRYLPRCRVSHSQDRVAREYWLLRLEIPRREARYCHCVTFKHQSELLVYLDP